MQPHRNIARQNIDPQKFVLPKINRTKIFHSLLALFIIGGVLLQPNVAAAQNNDVEVPAATTAAASLFLPVAFAPQTSSVPEANPLAIVASPDTSRAVTQTIPIEGGSMSVTATNGTLFTLTFPADALLSDEEIVMTPLASVDGMPLGAGLVAGVQLGPDGLRLLRPATLTIVGAPAVESGLLVAGFGYQTTGTEFHLRPVTESEGTFTLSLTHFSGYGVTAGTTEEIQTQATQHSPTAPDDAARQQLYADLGTPEGLQTWFEGLLLTDLLEGRDGNVDSMERAVFYFQVWLDIVKELGLEAEFSEMIDTGWKHLLIGLGNSVDRSYVACQNGDASQVVRIMRWGRIIKMLPVEPRREWISDNYINTTITQQVRGCATFELDFDSTLIQEWPNVPFIGQAHDSHLRAENIRVQFDLDTRLVEPTQAPLVYNSFGLAGDHPECQSGTTMIDDTFHLKDARINLNYSWGEKPKFSFKFDPGHPAETITYSCPLGTGYTVEPLFWNVGFWLIHWQELHVSELYFDFTEWNVVGKSLYAELITDRAPTAETQYFSGTTWMVLAHAPVK